MKANTILLCKPQMIRISHKDKHDFVGVYDCMWVYILSICW